MALKVQKLPLGEGLFQKQC